MYKKSKTKYGRIIIVLTCLVIARAGYAAQEVDPKIAQKIAQRKKAEQEIASSASFKALIDSLTKKHDQEVEQQAYSNKEKLEARRVQLHAAAMPEEQMVVELKALNNKQREEDKVLLAAQKQEKQREIRALVARKWPAHQQYALDFKNY